MANDNSIIINNGKADVADLHLYYRNARRGSVPEIAKSLKVNKQYVPITVNVGTHTGRPNEVLRGNHTVKAARDLGWKSLDVNYVDVDDDHARRIVLADNKTAAFGDYDTDLLAAEVSALDDLEGSGYSQEDLDKLLNGPDEDPVDSEHQEEYKNRWELVIELDSEEQQREVYGRLMEEGFRLRVLSL